MTRFLLSFFALYGGMHAYAFLRLRAAFRFGAGFGSALAVLMLVTTAAPVLVRVLDGKGYEPEARGLAYVGYFWMGLLFLFFCGTALFDFLNFAGRLAVWAARRSWPSSAPLPAGFTVGASLAFALAICVYGTFEAWEIRTERLRVETSKLPDGVDRLTIVQISDVHLGLIERSKRLGKILEVAGAAAPDILVSTGDLVDAEINHLPGLAELFRGVAPRFGKLAITGNHEFYAGLDRALAFTRASGFRILQGEAVSIGGITIAGVDDPTGAEMGILAPESEVGILSLADRDRFTILLKHRPAIDPEAARLFDLQLSGHTHKGQIWPFTLLSRLVYPLNAGEFELGGGSLLYVSRGSGTWGPPIRFRAPPEVTVIELVRKTS